MSREVMIIRHGEAYNTVADDGTREVRDRSNPPLTPRGEQQAAAVAPVVAGFRPDAVVVSPFLRVAQSALPALRLLSATGTFDVRMSEEFIFRPLARFRGVDVEDYARLVGEALPVVPGMADRATYPSFPESRRSLRTRVRALAEEWLRRDDIERVVFFGHGATVGGLIKRLDPSLRRSLPEPGHCSVTRMTQADDGSWNTTLLVDRSHLEGLQQERASAEAKA